MNAKLVDIGINRMRQPWRVNAHNHPFHEMICVLEGSQHVAIARREIVAREGDILLYPRGVAHEEWSPNRQPLETIYINFDWDGYNKNIPLCIRDVSGRIRIMADWLKTEVRSQTVMKLPLIQNLLDTLLYQFVVLCFSRNDGFVENVRAFIREHIDEPLSLDVLARHSGASKYYFVRKYRKATGRTPMEDVRELRIAYARQLILAASLPLKLIAPKVGLVDVYHMSRTFRRHLGISPGQLRRNVKQEKLIAPKSLRIKATGG
jgi:AraC family transcriptional regulator, arabinose operon regulatory protein